MSLETLQILKLVLEGGVAVIALFALIMYIFQQRNKDNKDAAERLGYIELLKTLAVNIDTSTQTLRAMEAEIQVVRTEQREASEGLVEKVQSLQTAVDGLPAIVREQLAADFKAVGESLSGLGTQTADFYQAIQRAQDEIKATLDRVIQRLVPVSSGGSAGTFPVNTASTDKLEGENRRGKANPGCADGRGADSAPAPGRSGGDVVVSPAQSVQRDISEA